jgi:ribonuclease D
VPRELRLVNDPAQDLGAMFDAISAEPRVALDTESDPYHRYYEKVCLLQLSTPAEDIVFDPLALGFPAPLRGLFEDRARMFVLHGADYDVRSLRRSFDVALGKIFDTLIAASLLGKKQLGLKALLETELGVVIDKSEQRSDWGQRPLSDKQLAYARQDTMHLLELAQKLEDQLSEKGRMSWMEEECELLRSKPATVREPDPDAHLKIKGARQLGEIARRALKAAFLHREAIAQKEDKPPFRIARNEQLLLLAHAIEKDRDVTLARLRKMRFLPRAMERETLAVALDRALSEPEAPVVVEGKPRSAGKPDADTKRRLDQLRAARLVWARDLGIDPGFLIAQSVLERLAESPPSTVDALRDIRGMTVWRIGAIGHNILRALGL